MLIAGVAPPARAEAAVQWRRDLNEALGLAVESNRPLLIEFYADWCAPCKVMDQQVYSDARIAALIQRNYVPLRLNFDLQRELVRRYNVEAIPHVVFANSYGTELLHHRGALNKAEMAAVLSALPSDVSAINHLDRRLQADGGDASALLEMGGALRSAGLFQASTRYYLRALKLEQARKDAGLRETLLGSLGANALELRESRDAARYFETCVKEFPSSPRRPDYMLRLAQAYLAAGRESKAGAIMKALIRDYPASDAARKGSLLLRPERPAANSR